MRRGAIVGRLREELEVRTGVAVRPQAEIASLEEAADELVAFREEAGEMAYHALEYLSGRPQEQRPERRQRLNQRARIAYMEDPLAGREVEMIADFAFGKGVSKPTARDPKVQEVIDRAWEESSNQDHLTGFMAQRKLSADLKTQANLFITLYEAGGRVRVGRLDADTVDNIVVDDEDRLRPLYYLSRRRVFKWDYDQDRMKTIDEVREGGRPKLVYYAHWRNVDDVNREREEAGESKLEAPPDDKLGKGIVYHVSINQLGEQLFGVSPFARSLRFLCHDETTETLTSEGWMGLPEIRRRHRAGTLPAVAGHRDGEMVFEQPLGLNVQHYDGVMARVSTKRGFDMLVTPNHRMLTIGGDHVEAQALYGCAKGMRPFAPVRAAVGSRPRVEEFVLPGVLEHEAAHPARPRSQAIRQRRARVLSMRAEGVPNVQIAARLGCTRQSVWQITSGWQDALQQRQRLAKKQRPALRLRMDAWLRWLGWWVAEGDSRGIVTQALGSDRLDEVKAACYGLGIPGREGVKRSNGLERWQWHPARPKQIVAWLEAETGVGSHEKRLPQFVFELPVEQQMILLRALMGGDGTPTNWERDGWGRYYTVSDQLADDVQRLATLCGYRARATLRSNPGRGRMIWWIDISTPKARRLPCPKSVPYAGLVYCFTTPSGNVVTRRNGVVGISGNSGMNKFTESRVTMALASASFIAKRVVKGGQNALVKSATRMLGRTGELGSGAEWARDPTMSDPGADIGLEGGFLGRAPQRPLGPGQRPPAPASIRHENEADRLESLNLNSGAAAAQQDAQIIRAPIAAASGWGQHYLGDASNINLAGGTVLELPALMMVGAWQQVFEDLFRWFVDRAIEAAIRNGELGGHLRSVHDSGGKLSEFRLREAEDVAQFKDRTGIDLSYEFKMPRPGRRDLGEVVDACVAAQQAFDPRGANIPFRRVLLTFLFGEGLELDDPSRAVMEAVPDDAEPATPLPVAPGLPVPPGQGGEPPSAGPGQPADTVSQYGEPRKPSTPKEAAARIKSAEWIPEDLREEVAEHVREAGELFEATVLASANGAGAE